MESCQLTLDTNEATLAIEYGGWKCYNVFITNEEGNSMQDIIGIGGIIATIVVGFITCGVTWIVAKKSQKIMKLSWNAKTSKVLNTGSQFGKEKMQLLFEGNLIDNPNILQIWIKNTGNSAIDTPIIKIRINNGTRLIPAGFIDIPYGYEDKWKMEVISENECEILPEYINTKQELSAIFYVDGMGFDVDVSCPMRDVAIKEDYRVGETREERKDRIINYILVFYLVFIPIVAVINGICSNV